MLLPLSTVYEVLQTDPVNGGPPHDLLEAQQEDPEVLEIVEYT